MRVGIMNDIQVIRITTISKLPTIPGKMIWKSGVDTEYRARCWGEQNNHRTVWWSKAARRAYAIEQEPGGLAS